MPDTLLQEKLRLKPNSVNRSLMSLKRYFAWLLSRGQMKYDNVYSFLDWVETDDDTNLSREESDKQYYQEMAKRGLSEEDIDWCGHAEWTIVTNDDQEHPTSSLSFDVDGFIQWRW